LVSMIFKPFF